MRVGCGIGETGKKDEKREAKEREKTVVVRGLAGRKTNPGKKSGATKRTAWRTCT